MTGGRRFALTSGCSHVLLAIMPLSASPSRARLAAVGAFVGSVAGFLAACGGESARSPSDAARIDSLVQRADSFSMPATQTALLLDSLRMAIEASVRETSDSARRAVSLDPEPASAKRSAQTATRVSAGRGAASRAEAPAGLAPEEIRTRAKGDTVRGVLVMSQAAPVPQVILLTANGQREVTLSGMAASGMSRMVGAEVVVRGFLVSPRDVVVSDYIVRSMNGVPAFDGMLVEQDGGWSLSLTDGSGRKRLAVVPPALRAAVGSRVWVSMKPGDNAPAAHGVVRRQ